MLIKDHSAEITINMRFLRVLIILWIISCLSYSALARGKTRSSPIYGKENLATEISRAINAAGSNAVVGIHIKSMKNGDILYRRNEKSTFDPASTLKILTAEAALLYLGPQYKFTTRFYTDAKSLDDGVLNGNLYLVHSGDPTLTYDALINLMVALKSAQIQQITGSVFIDTTAYDQVNYGPGWVWNDKNYCYAAPINASIIDRNCLSFRIAPGKAAGRPANIIQSPRYYYSGIQNFVTTKPSWARKSCYIRLEKTSNSSIALSGCMPKGHYAQGVTTVITDITDYNRSLVRNLFTQYGIRIGGTVTMGGTPANLPIVASHESKPLYVLINEMLKKSDNIIAGSLFKKIGALYTGQPGSWGNGSSAVSEILSKNAGVNTWRMDILDGSGLSHYNRITPTQMIDVLDFAYHNSNTNYEFLSALPVAGVDGTLKHRMRNIARRVRAKTGTTSGVSSLAGYVISRDREPFAFVIMINGREGYGWKYREVEDIIVSAVANYSRG